MFLALMLAKDQNNSKASHFVQYHTLRDTGKFLLYSLPVQDKTSSTSGFNVNLICKT